MNGMSDNICNIKHSYEMTDQFSCSYDHKTHQPPTHYYYLSFIAEGRSCVSIPIAHSDVTNHFRCALYKGFTREPFLFLSPYAIVLTYLRALMLKGRAKRKVARSCQLSTLVRILKEKSVSSGRIENVSYTLCCQEGLVFDCSSAFFITMHDF